MPNLENIPDFGKIPVFPKIKFEPSDWKDGIVARTPNWLGDAVMAIPAMMQLKKAVPDTCGFFAVVPPGLADLFDSLSFVDVTIPLRQAHKAWSKTDIRRVKHSHPGIGLLYNNSLRDAIYFKIAKIPKVFGAAARGRSLLLTQSFAFPQIKGKSLNKLHHAGRYLALSYALGAPEWEGDFPVFDNLKEPEITSDCVNEVLNVDQVMVVAPGAAYGEAKRWPAENFSKVCEYWIKEGGQVVIVGTKAEVSVAEEVAKGLPDGKIHNLAGKTDMKDLLSILQHAEWCVANDSGVMHLSAILGKKGVAIFGSTDPTSTCPVSTRWEIVFEKLDCAPCFKRECTLGHYNCLCQITPDKVIAKLET